MKYTEAHKPQIEPREGLTAVKLTELGAGYFLWILEPLLGNRLRWDMLNSLHDGQEFGSPVPLPDDGQKRTLIVSFTTARELMDGSKLG